jgi:hypothetical protein
MSFPFGTPPQARRRVTKREERDTFAIRPKQHEIAMLFSLVVNKPRPANLKHMVACSQPTTRLLHGTWYPEFLCKAIRKRSRFRLGRLVVAILLALMFQGALQNALRLSACMHWQWQSSSNSSNKQEI